MRITIHNAGQVVISKQSREAAGLKLATVKIIRKGSVLVARIAGAKKTSSRNVNEFVRKLREGKID